MLLQTFNPGKSAILKHYDSTNGTSEKLMLTIFIVVALFSLYVGIKVRKSIKEEQKNKLD